MNYSECTLYLERLGNEVLTMKFGLDTIRTLLSALENPEARYPSLLVAGTNGKGSVARFISSVCSESGLKTGLFTSPHLVSVTERFRVDGEKISQELFAQELTTVAEAIAELQLETHPTFFETITATALHYFSKELVDIAVLEVGLGGRLDSTNAVEPILSILTEISYDHQQYLGETLGQIGAEKAGILRANRRALSLPQVPEVRQALQIQAEKLGTQLEEVGLSEVERRGSEGGQYSFRFHGQEYQLLTRGEHQVKNAALAVRATEILQDLGFPIDPRSTLQGIQKTSVPGVLEKQGDNPEVFFDGGHNPEAIASLENFVRLHTREPRKLVFGIMRDKMIEPILTTLTRPFQEVYLTQIPSPRAALAEDLQRLYPEATIVADPYQAYELALTGASTTVVAGSFQLVGEILKGQ